MGTWQNKILYHAAPLLWIRDAAVRFGPVQRHFLLNLKPDHWSGSPNPLNLGPDLVERVQMVRFRFRVI
jgi:hypothetical protein